MSLLTLPAPAETVPSEGAPADDFATYGGIPAVRLSDGTWVLTVLYRHARCWERATFGPHTYRCQLPLGHYPDEGAAHRHLVDGAEVLAWWPWGNGRTVKRLYPAHWRTR